MRETMFDDSYNIREVLDDVIERVTLREKLISTAKQFAEKKREDRYTLTIKEKGKTADKIDDLFNRIRTHNPGVAGSTGRDAFSDVLSGMPKDLFSETPETSKEVTRKAPTRG